MTSSFTLDSSVIYSGKAESVRWEGRVVKDEDRFKQYMAEVVRPRIRDEESAFEAEILGLATTGMETKFVQDFLAAIPDHEDWEVGEALAECVLSNDAGKIVYWPWNTIRDRRTPRASLPGADLVGFICEVDQIFLLLGEVKTSRDIKTPPGVMRGSSGMTWQLQQNATRLDVQHTLLQWLQARCKEQPFQDFYRIAVARYLQSKGKDLILVGVLLRDTSPSELDLQGRARTLSAQFGLPTRFELLAWYLPSPIDQWSTLVSG